MNTAGTTLVPGTTAKVRRDWSPIAHPAEHDMLAHTPDPKGYHQAQGGIMLPRADRFGGSTGFRPTDKFVVNIDPQDPFDGTTGTQVDLAKVSKANAKEASDATNDPATAWELLASKTAEVHAAQPLTAVQALPTTVAPIQYQQPQPASLNVPQMPTQGNSNMIPMPVSPGYTIPAVSPQPVVQPPTAPVFMPQPQPVQQPAPLPQVPQPDYTSQIAMLAAAVQVLLQQKQAAPVEQAASRVEVEEDDPKLTVTDEDQFKDGPEYETGPVMLMAGIPQRPKVPVVFRMPGGSYRQHFHHVSVRGSSIFLFYDDRYSSDSRFQPSPTDVEKDDPIFITLPQSGDKTYKVHVLPLSNNLGHVDIVQLLIVRDEPVEVVQTWQPPTSENPWNSDDRGIGE